MSDVPQGPDWWLASDGKWYPQPPDLPPPPPPPPPGWWLAPDGHWYPPPPRLPPQPWKRLFGLGVLLSVVGVVAGVASWHPSSEDAHGCPQDQSIELVSVVLWIVGVVIAVLGFWWNARWDRQFHDTGLRRRLPVVDTLFVLGAVVLPWFVYAIGYNMCFNQ